MPTMSITTTAGQASRVAEAFGAKLNLGRNANESEVKADVINYIRSTVLSYENRVAIAALVETPLDPT